MNYFIRNKFITKIFINVGICFSKIIETMANIRHVFRKDIRQR